MYTGTKPPDSLRWCAATTWTPADGFVAVGICNMSDKWSRELVDTEDERWVRRNVSR